MSCLSLTMSKSVLPVLMIAACWDALLVVQNKGVAFSSPATETRIKPTTDEQDVSDLLKSTESAILTEQFPSESTKPFFQGASTVIKPAELELTQQDSTINEETELATNTPATRLNITRESSQDATTDTPNGLELTQQDSTINEETELATNTPPTGLNISRESSQDATTDTPNGLELTQRDSTINEETELATNTPATGLNITRESSQDATTDTQNGLELTQQDPILISRQ
ncbi:uncharacterized protein LOC110829255 [Zootermopsis nevadensis]|uniref:uncharacterized protein LOC110829255 n=1 Tax=Zootermopsis nevadensis TaxID=136037 RepID=UPI000B8E525C|nr:uncharacterized protein LOC110829255 [Zootermopsis nevadensis]